MNRVWRIAPASGIAGALVSGALAFSRADYFESSGTIRVARITEPKGQVERRVRMAATASRALREAATVEVVRESEREFTVSAAHKDRHRARELTGELMMALARSEAQWDLESVEVLEPSLPILRGGSRPLAAADAGFGGGALLGILVSLAIRRRQQPAA